MDISIWTMWVIVVLLIGSILIFVGAIIALIASNIVTNIDRNKAIDNTALAMNGSSHSSEIQARMMVLASVSKSELSQNLFKLFENLSLTSLVMIGLAFFVFLSAIFI